MRVKRLMGLGIGDGFLARLLSWDANRASTAVTAAGTNLATATELTKPLNVLGTVASGTGVRIGKALIGELVWIRNSGANTVNIFPIMSTAAINGGTAGAAVTLATTKNALLFPISDTVQYLVAID